MNTFSISQLSQYSGIKQHTIRIWEQRYNAFKPSRTDGNTRYYDSSQLRRLLNIVTLVKSGHRVSEVCQMPDEKLFELLDAETKESSDEEHEYLISQLLMASVSYDESRFDKIFAHSLLRYGMKDCYIQVLYPMLIRVGVLWASDKIPAGQEHFISNCIRRKLFTAIDSLPPPGKGSETWLLFLPENEFHEIGLLLACYLIRLSGDNVIYLGANVPYNSVIDAITTVNPQKLLIFFVHKDLPDNIHNYINKLTNVFNQKVYVSSPSHQILDSHTDNLVRYLSSPEDLLKQLN